MKGYSSCRIIIGSRAKRVRIPNSDITHEWTAYVKAPKEIVKNVQWKLHESFNNNLILTEYPFEIKEQGWGEFTMQVKIILHNDDRLNTSHFLKLHGDDDVVINETIDEIVYKGVEISKELTPEEESEHKKINEAIDYMLDLFKDID